MEWGGGAQAPSTLIGMGQTPDFWKLYCMHSGTSNKGPSKVLQERNNLPTKDTPPGPFYHSIDMFLTSEFKESEIRTDYGCVPKVFFIWRFHCILI